MNEPVENYIQQRLKEQKYEQRVQKAKHLISIGLYEKEYAPDEIGNDVEYPDFDNETRKHYRCNPLPVSNEDYQRILALEQPINNEVKKSVDKETDKLRNTTASFICAIGWIVIIVGVILGFVLGTTDLTFMIICWTSGVISGVLILGLYQIIILLEKLNLKLDKIKRGYK